MRINPIHTQKNQNHTKNQLVDVMCFFFPIQPAYVHGCLLKYEITMKSHHLFLIIT